MAREERITLKIPANSHRQIVKAAAMAGESIGTFIASSVRERAQQILAQPEALTLSAQDWDEFVPVLDNSPPPNGRLKAAMHKHFL